MATVHGSKTGRVRLAVLVCGNPMAGAIRQYGGWAGFLEDRLQRSFAEESYAPELIISSHNVLEGPRSYPSLEKVDALLITGSSKSIAAQGASGIAEYCPQYAIRPRTAHGSLCFSVSLPAYSQTLTAVLVW